MGVAKTLNFFFKLKRMLNFVKKWGLFPRGAYAPFDTLASVQTGTMNRLSGALRRRPAAIENASFLPVPEIPAPHGDH